MTRAFPKIFVFMSFMLARLGPAKKRNYMIWKSILDIHFLSRSGLHDRLNCFVVGVSRGNTIRGNRTERFWEGNLPLRGSLRGSLRGRVSEVFRGFQRFSEVFRDFQRFSEVFRGFQRFSEVFQRPSQRPSQSAIFLSELRVVLPLIVLPLKTPAILGIHVETISARMTMQKHCSGIAISYGEDIYPFSPVFLSTSCLERS